MRTTLRCGHVTTAEPTVRSPQRHKDLWTCSEGCGLQRRETSKAKRARPTRTLPPRFGQR